ncbi:hypothetical protein, partial [Bartonella henselae]
RGGRYFVYFLSVAQSAEKSLRIRSTLCASRGALMRCEEVFGKELLEEDLFWGHWGGVRAV